LLTTYLLDPALCIQTGAFASFLGWTGRSCPRAPTRALPAATLSEIVVKEAKRLVAQIKLRLSRQRVIDGASGSALAPRRRRCPHCRRRIPLVIARPAAVRFLVCLMSRRRRGFPARSFRLAQALASGRFQLSE